VLLILHSAAPDHREVVSVADAGRCLESGRRDQGYVRIGSLSGIRKPPCPRPLYPQEQTSDDTTATSVLCQTRKSPGSFNHLVGEQLKGVGHREAEGRGGLEINDEFVFERELNWQIARICASQNLVHV
jgi:hypothetical protein